MPSTTKGAPAMTIRRTFGAIRRLPSGRFQASHAHPETGARINAPRTFPTRKLAADWLKAQDVDLSRGTWAPPAPKTAPVLFGAYATAWLDRRAPGLKPRTVAEYRRLYAATIEPSFATVPVASIDRAAVRAWHNALDASTPTQRARAYTLLRGILGAAVDDELIPVNPAQIRGAGTVKPAREVTPATADEVAAIAAAMPARWAALVHLAGWMGLRFGELAGLTREDVDLAAGVLHVRRAVSRVDGRTIVHTPKSDAGVRTVPILPHLAPILELHLDVYAGPVLLFTAAGDETAHVSHGSLSQAFQRAREAAGRPDLHLHGLRHSAASLWRAAGASATETAHLLGQSSEAMASRYSHPYAERLVTIAARLSDQVAA